jgi:hypothetical protein
VLPPGRCPSRASADDQALTEDGMQARSQPAPSPQRAPATSKPSPGQRARRTSFADGLRCSRARGRVALPRSRDGRRGFLVEDPAEEILHGASIPKPSFVVGRTPDAAHPAAARGGHCLDRRRAGDPRASLHADAARGRGDPPDTDRQRRPPAAKKLQRHVVHRKRRVAFSPITAWCPIVAPSSLTSRVASTRGCA